MTGGRGLRRRRWGCRSMSRHKDGPTIGLALSGGAILGMAHIGVLQVLEEHDIHADLIAGTSAGSLVGLAYCAGMSPAKMEEVALSFRWDKVGRPVPPRMGLFDTERMDKFLVELFGDVNLQDLPIPLSAVAVDLLTSEVVVLREGRAAAAVRASCAVPGIFPPVEIDGRLLIDGGVVDNLPVSVVRQMGADYVIAVDLMQSNILQRDRPRNLLEVWALSLFILMRNAQHEAGLADIVLVPDTASHSWVDVANARRLIERGREAAEAALPAILRDLGREDAR